jgi:hypothetical protein
MNVRARQTPSGDWAISWIRRTRVGGDDWEAVDVPLAAPDLDEYVLEITDGLGAVLRTIAASGPSATYTAAMMVTDFGMPVTDFVGRLYQVSEIVGRGAPWDGVIAAREFGA